MLQRLRRREGHGRGTERCVQRHEAQNDMGFGGKRVIMGAQGVPES